MTQTHAYYVMSPTANADADAIPGIGSIENLDNIIASAAQSSPFSFALPMPLSSMMGSSMMSNILASPAMALNRLRSANQPLMIEIPNHVLNADFNSDPSNYQVMPLHQCKYCSSKGGSALKGPARYLRKPMYQQQQQQQSYGKTRPQNQYPVKSSGGGGGGGYKRPMQQIHQYPVKGQSKGYNNKMPNNQKIVVVVLHMKNDKLTNFLPGGTKGGQSFSRGDEQQQQMISQSRYAAPSTSNHQQIYFEPANQRYNSEPLVATLSADPAVTAKPADASVLRSSESHNSFNSNSHFNHNHNYNTSPAMMSDRSGRAVDHSSSSPDVEMIAQTKEDESSYSSATTMSTTATTGRF